ncbi:helix-turn-helix transcriptional regulator [Nocardia asteroides]|nr:helix-turn-helix transcriptional regulator [Nocardia asteroides]
MEVGSTRRRGYQKRPATTGFALALHCGQGVAEWFGSVATLLRGVMRGGWMQNWEAFGAELRRRRSQAGLSVRELARSLSYDPGALSRLENGRRKPPLDIVRKLDRVLESDGALAIIYESLIAPVDADEQSTLLHSRESSAMAERRYIDRGLAAELGRLLSETTVGGSDRVRTRSAAGSTSNTGRVSARRRGPEVGPCRHGRRSRWMAAIHRLAPCESRTSCCRGPALSRRARTGHRER